METIFEDTKAQFGDRKDAKPVWKDLSKDDPDIDLDNIFPWSSFPATVGGSDDTHQQSSTNEQPNQLIFEPLDDQMRHDINLPIDLSWNRDDPDIDLDNVFPWSSFPATVGGSDDTHQQSSTSEQPSQLVSEPPPLPSHTKTLLEKARHIKGMHIRSTRSFASLKECFEAEIRFVVLTDEEVTEASIGNIFDPAYDPNQWMLYADFRERFHFAMTWTMLDWPDTVEDWLEKKLSMSEEERAANDLFATSESNAQPKEPLENIQATFEETADLIYASQDLLASKTTTVQNMTQYRHHDLDLDLKTRPFPPSNHPVVEAFKSRLGDLILLQKRLDDTLDERRYLMDELEVRMKHCLSLGTEKQNFLDKSGLLLSGMRKQIAILEVEVDVMKEECLARHLLDENGDPITVGDGESSKRTIFPSSHSAIDTSRHNSDTLAKTILVRSKVVEIQRVLRKKQHAILNAEDRVLAQLEKSLFSADLWTTNTSTAKTGNHKAHSNGRRGVKGKVNGKDVWAFCDTGAGQNVIAARHAKQMGLKMKHRPTLLRMGNSNQVLSPGVVRYPWAFSDDPLIVTTIIAHVLDDFKYDCLLGNPFLRFSQLMTKHIHRFVKGVFPSSNIWSLNLLGETSHRVQGVLGNNVVMEALPDIGSSRNVMDAVWAKSSGFAIRSSPEHCGVIIFPDNSIRATIGQVHTTVTLPDGEVTPIIFEVLPDCYVPVVLGEDFVFDNNLFMNHAEAIYEAEGIDCSQDLLCMDYQQQSFFAKIGSRAQVLLRPKEKQKERHDRKGENNPLNDTAELKRQQEWNSKYQHGQIASRDEWDTEQKRRIGHERRQYPNWRPNSQKSLIKFRPILDDHGRSTTAASTSSDRLFEPGNEPTTSNVRRSDPQEPPAFDEAASSDVVPMTSPYSSPSFASFGFEEAALWGED
ncbi:hypothetical protein ACEPPN_010851 [Leptodophora sp. 'Broadleaf-Isolate-01']